MIAHLLPLAGCSSAGARPLVAGSYEKMPVSRPYCSCMRLLQASSRTAGCGRGDVALKLDWPLHMQAGVLSGSQRSVALVRACVREQEPARREPTAVGAPPARADGWPPAHAAASHQRLPLAGSERVCLLILGRLICMPHQGQAGAGSGGHGDPRSTPDQRAGEPLHQPY